jgi:hypothetical protein
MDSRINIIDKTEAMPSGDDAEQVLPIIDRYIVGGIMTLPPDLAVEMPNLRRICVAYLALMRMHEAKIEGDKGHKPLQLTKCRSCQAGIVWVKTKTGKNMPVDADTWTQGDPHLFDPELGHISHFATCPNADDHRKTN